MSRSVAGLSRAWVVAGMGLAVALWLSSLGHGINQTDEAWNVQVLDRVAGGASLYEGVFFGAPPFSIWVALPFAWTFGSQIAVLKALCAIVAAATALLAAWLAGRYGAGRAGQAAVALACVLYGWAPGTPLYTPLATLCMLGCLAGAHVWRERVALGRPTADSALLVAGAAAGLTAASKQSLGAYATIALLSVIWFASPHVEADVRRRASDSALALAACAGAFALVVLPVAAMGDLPEFFRYAVGKGEYTSTGAVSYLDTFDGFIDMLATPATNTRGLLVATSVLAPPLALAALPAVAWRSRTGAIALGAFSLAAIAGIFPRADVSHIQAAVPVCAITIAAGTATLAGVLGGPVRRAVSAAAVTALVAAAAWVVVATPLRSLRDGYVVSSLPHLAGPLIHSDSEDASREIGSALRDADRGRDRLLVVSPAAGYLYLASGVDSPTRFDYPETSTFRGDDQGRVALAVAEGELGPVCVNDAAGTLFAPLAPRELLDFVVANLDPVATLEPPGAGIAACTLYGTRKPPLR